MEGTYDIADTIDCEDNLTLAGMGRGTQLKASDDITIFNVNNDNDLTIKNMFLDGGGNSARIIKVTGSCDNNVYSNLRIENSTVNYMVEIYDATNLLIENCVLTNNTYNAFRVLRLYKAIIRNNYLTDGSGAASYIGICCSRNIIVTGNIIKAATSFSTDRGSIWIGSYYQDARNITVSNNILDSIMDYDAITFIGNGGAGYKLEDIRIEGNIISNVDRDGIANPEMASSDDSLQNVVIANNIITNCTKCGIRLIQPGTGYITGMEIRDNQFMGNDSVNVSIGANITIINRGSGTFTALATADTTVLYGVTADDIYWIQGLGSTPWTTQLGYTAKANSLIVTCTVADTAKARAGGYNWLRLQ